MTSVAMGGSGTVDEFKPAKYISPLDRAKISGEKEKMGLEDDGGVTKTVWERSVRRLEVRDGGACESVSEDEVLEDRDVGRRIM